MTNQAPERVNIAFVVALDTEFRTLHEYVGEWRPYFIERYGVEDYRFEIDRSDDEQPITCAACFIDDMGPGHAGDATHRIIDVWNPDIIINVGIAASLKPSDVKIGDVVVVSKAKEYAPKAKVSEGASGPNIEPGGDYFNADPALVSAVRQFEFSNKSSYLDWKSSCAKKLVQTVPPKVRDRLIVDDHLRAEPSISKVSLASGPIVGAAEAFKKWIIGTDRNIKALEMEAAGVLRAVSSRPTTTKPLVLRGISDFADSKKTALDQVSDGVFRRLAMSNCLDLIWRLVRTGRLDRALGLHSIQPPPMEAKEESAVTPRTAHIAASNPNIERIKASVASLDVSVAQLALLTLAYARELGDSEFSQWLSQEIEGYENTDPDGLPDYRSAQVSSKANMENIAKRISNHPIPMQNLESNIRERDDLPEDTRTELADMVAEQNFFKVLPGLMEVENYANRAPGENMQAPWPDQLMTFALPFVFNLTPTHAWQVIPPAVFKRVLDAVRKRIFDYVFPPSSASGSS